MRSLLGKLGRPRIVAIASLAACWAATMLGPLSLLIIPLVAVGGLAAARKRSWLLVLALLLLNPLSIAFYSGVAAWIGGAPHLRFVGLPGIESHNVDRRSRCFKSGGGCLVYGNEWVYIVPHNAAARLMSAVFGPASKCYDGPYPTKEEALALAEQAPATPVEDFREGTIRVDGQALELGRKTTRNLAHGLCLYDLADADMDSGYKPAVQAMAYRRRCIILRLSQADAEGNRDEEDFHALAYVVLLDRDNGRPFAYFATRGESATRFHPVGYLED